MLPEDGDGTIEPRAGGNPNHGPDGRFTSGPGGGAINKNLPQTICEQDIAIGKSVGAKAKNYDVMDLATGEVFHFSEGSKIQNVEIFAGKGTRTPFRNTERLIRKYGGKPENWQHAKGFGKLETPDGDRTAEVHWAQCEGVGKVDFFIKRWME